MQTDSNSNEKDAEGKFCGHAILGDELKRRMRFLAAALPMRMVRTGTRCQNLRMLYCRGSVRQGTAAAESDERRTVPHVAGLQCYLVASSAASLSSDRKGISTSHTSFRVGGQDHVAGSSKCI